MVYREIKIDGKRYYQKRRDGYWYDDEGKRYMENYFGEMEEVSTASIITLSLIATAIVGGVIFLNAAILLSLFVGGIVIGIFGGLLKKK